MQLAPAEARAGESCATCGAPLDPFQEYCLECGGRAPRPSGPIHMLGAAWRRHVRWYPGDWLWPSLAAAVVAAVGATAAILATRDAHGGSVETIVATTAIPRAPATTPTANEELPTAPAEATPARRGRQPRVLNAWPDGNGFTIVLETLPATRGFAAAHAKAEAVARSGLPQVGVLESSRYASLHPGYYVIFSGIYASLEDAQTALQRVSPRFPAAYARQIVT